MKGWEFTGTHQPLKIVEKPDPKAKPGYVVLKTLAGGLCHSDVSALDIESWMGSFNVPVIMGHEVCGEIVEIGHEFKEHPEEFKKQKKKEKEADQAQAAA